MPWKNRSLESIIEDLTTHLAELDIKFLIIMDDLDRLQPEEIRQILTLVKTFGNLPGIIHLLVYDRSIIDAALASNDNGRPSFREKIVQAEFDLPLPRAEGLRAMTFDKLVSIVGANPPMEERDWWEITQVAFAVYIRSPRDVVRMTNAIMVSWPSIQGEAYLPDFIAIEIFRHFDRNVYEAIRDKREFLIGTDGFTTDDEKKDHAKYIVDATNKDRQKSVSKLLALLFPQHSQHFRKDFEIQHPEPPAFSGRRVGDPTGFDVFFSLAAPTGELSVQELRELSENFGELSYIATSLEKAFSRRRPNGASYVGRYINCLIDLAQEGHNIPAGFLRLLLEMGDKIVEAGDIEKDSFRIDNRYRLSRLIEIAASRLPADQIGKVISKEIASLTLRS